MLRSESVTLESGLNLSYAEHGTESGPAVVMLPGPTDSWRSYASVLDSLPRWIRAIAVSHRGHGDSDKPNTGYRVQDFAADAVEFLNALEIDRAVLVGHSGSCLVTRNVALGDPEDELADRIPDAELIVYPGMGHTPRWDDPKQFSEDLTAFIERVHTVR